MRNLLVRVSDYFSVTKQMGCIIMPLDRPVTIVILLDGPPRMTLKRKESYGSLE